MKSRSKKFGALLSAILVLTTLTVAPTAASAALPTSKAICYTATSYTSGSLNWNGKSPKTCPGSYRLYDLTAVRPRLVVAISNTQRVTFQQLVAREYEAANRWCASNSLTCTIFTGIGFAIVGKYFR